MQDRDGFKYHWLSPMGGTTRVGALGFLTVIVVGLFNPFPEWENNIVMLGYGAIAASLLEMILTFILRGSKETRAEKLEYALSEINGKAELEFAAKHIVERMNEYEKKWRDAGRTGRVFSIRLNIERVIGDN